MYQITAYTILGQVFKTKRVETKPTFSQLNRIRNRWDLAYGACLRIEVTECTK